ncbi:hypothetical protein MKW98_013232 [Papaver atlanticum]|uniref:High-affinity nitrate transporter n=1 Tax=Papaver atlanticum TaxID=357466 RepID=A0AAD4SHX8_9MAGN|nr:hypothetical protein MKW98_013232 [Papaver atlanticum]
MVSSSQILVFSFVLLCFAGTCYGEKKKLHFSDLKNVLTVKTDAKENQVMKAGEEKITVTWGYNKSSPAGTDADFKKVKVELCFAPVSQKQRAWRKTEEEVHKDKTCQFLIVSKPYIAAEESFTWTIQKNIPSATYFVRAYVFNSADQEVAFGQSTDDKHAKNLFTVQAITGRHASIDICAGVFSAFSVITLFVFFFLEKRKKA